MRKIEQQMITVLLTAGRSATMGNTAVTRADGVANVYLHGHMIARLHGDGALEVSLAGWNTPTTRSRLSAIVKSLAHNGGQGLGVSSAADVVRLHDARGTTVIDATGWHKVARRLAEG